MGSGTAQECEIERLRRTTRDLVALSTLPAIWNQFAPEQVLDSLAGVLASTLDLDAVLVRLQARGAQDPASALRGRAPDAAAYRATLETLLDGAAGTPLADPLVDAITRQPLRGTTMPIGLGGELGMIAALSRRSDFPLEHERMLLGVAANQTAGVLHRKLAEQAFQRSELRFLEFADTAPAMLWVTEADGSCSFLSRGWYEFTGQGRNQGLGFGWTAAIHPDDREAASKAFLRANEQKSAFNLEHRLIHRDGSCRWVIDAGRPRFGSDGAFLGFVGSVLDITDRRRTEQALRETQGMLAAVFEALPVGVAVFDQGGAVRLSNQEMQQYLPTGILPSRDEQRHSRWRGFHPDGRPYTRQDFAGARALRAERVVPGIELLYTGDDGKEIWTQVAAVPLHGADGRPNGQVSVVMNIDAFKRTEAALRQAEAKQRALFDELTRSHRHLSQFLAVLAHELRNPLAPILSGLELMRLRGGASEVVTNVRGVIERQVGQLSHLIDDLLDIARVTNGKVELKTALHDLQRIVADAVETSVPLIEQRGHAFTLELPEEALPVRADATRIAQVVGNLLTNAAKYTPPGGRIGLSVRRDGADALIAVSDNGLGIPAESLEAVFDMFSQVGRNMAHSQGGLGIGLALVRQLVALHGGAVSASSGGAGQGSTFVVRLPLASEHVAAAGAAPAQPAGATASRRILVTDDNVDAAETLGALLELFGHEVRIAHDGPQALRIGAQFHPQVVFLDIGLPGMNGYEVAARLRALDMPRCAIVAVSGWGAPDDLLRAREAGFDQHFTKPVAAARVSEFLSTLA